MAAGQRGPEGQADRAELGGRVLVIQGGSASDPPVLVKEGRSLKRCRKKDIPSHLSEECCLLLASGVIMRGRRNVQ